MRFYIIFCTNVMSGLPLWCTDLCFGLPRASSPLQSPICHSCSLLLDFLLPLLRFKVQSSDISRSFWTSSCLPSASKSILPLFLAPFGLPHISPPPQSPILSSCSLLLDFRASPLHFKVQSSALARSFWTSSCLPSASRSIPQLLLAPFGLPPASPPLQSPILRSFSLLLDFLLPPLRLKVQSSAISHSFWTSSCLPSASRSIPPRSRSPPRKKGGLQSNPPVAIRQSQSTSPILHQPIPPSKAPAISATSESGTRTYLPSGTNHFPIGLSAPALTASTANFFPATQKNIIAASIAPSGQM